LFLFFIDPLTFYSVTSFIYQRVWIFKAGFFKYIQMILLVIFCSRLSVFWFKRDCYDHETRIKIVYTTWSLHVMIDTWTLLIREHCSFQVKQDSEFRNIISSQRSLVILRCLRESILMSLIIYDIIYSCILCY